ncbi:hypothetical protein A33Q_2274 [Indibacter alkaliphilus LW1]|uniref:HEAT repeat domain-containing protein n=1 Tax=Indibacter alkaliphilus (strain CCUG 57479 / KCTC 22604 / LW1) TaxID=1189612 RepID=S2DC64_INDAL|nr:hypothetical protein [Indibacter alkaliphilus]EOZ96504.1 hypothetical protein A33Q_2274 [Indibacter alkaliphilus LW1]
MKHTSLTIIILFLFNLAWSQDSDKIIKSFIQIGEVQYEYIGYNKSELYRAFEKLRDNSDLEYLVELTTHENPIVKCYASWALADRDYPQLDKVMKSFLAKDETFTIHTMDIKDSEKLSVSFYHRYWNRLTQQEKEKDEKIQRLDSIILYSPNTDRLLTLRVLENRIYPQKYHPRIEELAFNEHNKSAIFYLSNWYKAEYHQDLKTALIEYLKDTEFKNVGVREYYQVIFELLNFRNEKTKAVVVNRLRTDLHWKNDRQRFISLLQDHSIYESDLQ